MGDAGEILRQISSFKSNVDKVNEEIEQTIQMTTLIEADIVQYSEIEKSYHRKESELTKMVSVGEFELNDLISVAAAGKNSLEVLGRDLEMVKKDIDETKERISAKREKFVALCDRFQSDIGEGKKDELNTLLLEKESLENEKRGLIMKINALQTSTRELLEEILEEIHNSSSGLEAEIQHRTSEKVELLKDIGELKNLLRSLGQTQLDLFLESEAMEQLRSYESDNLSVFLTDIIKF